MARERYHADCPPRDNLDRWGLPAVRPVIETWWERWNRECGTSLTAADARRISRRVARTWRG
jgi:hypothetical protein